MLRSAPSEADQQVEARQHERMRREIRALAGVVVSVRAQRAQEWARAGVARVAKSVESNYERRHTAGRRRMNFGGLPRQPGLNSILQS